MSSLQTRWRILISVTTLPLIVILLVRSDMRHLQWVAGLSAEGSPPPSSDVNSISGYTASQHHFLGFRERGATFRWIAATEVFLSEGPLAPRIYKADELPDGRASLLPAVQTMWCAAVARGIGIVTGAPTGPAVERMALWEPVFSHALAALALAMIVGRRFGALASVLATLAFALFPPLTAQFLSGVLTTGPWALLLAAYAMILHLPSSRFNGGSHGFGWTGGLAAGISLWLDPAFGFPVIVLGFLAGLTQVHQTPLSWRYLRWSSIGFGITMAACLIDRTPWRPEVGELRYIHPLYGFAWLGFGLALEGVTRWLTRGRRSRDAVMALMAIPLIGGLAYVQIEKGFSGWIYPGAYLRRLTSLDETILYRSLPDWAARATAFEVVLTLIPITLAAAVLILPILRAIKSSAKRSGSISPAVVLFAGVLLLSFFRIRWLAIGALVSVPILCGSIAAGSRTYRRAAMTLCALFLCALSVWKFHLPATLNRPDGTVPPFPQDLDALINRQFAHWLASHSPGQPIAALAPPELSDSLVFHGGTRVLMSTAWECYSGQVAASRILSAPESSEAEAVLSGRGITHVIIPLWDKVLPLLVRGPATDDKATLYARLRRWVFPPYMRPYPYHLPRAPGYEDKTLLVYKVTASQDEGLALSRLAEYFIELERQDLAAQVQKVLQSAYREDPNAAIARALVFHAEGRKADFEHELNQVISESTTGNVLLPWDRRVQRAIVFALGKRPDLARPEMQACLSEATRADVLDLTPLQAFRLRGLAARFGFSFAETDLMKIVESLSAEFAPVVSRPAAR